MLDLRSLPASVLLAASLAASLATSAHASLLFGSNLITNGNAEQGPNDASGNQVASIPFFTSIAGGMTVVPYNNASGYPVSTDPGPADRGNQFFAGGNYPSSAITQTVSVADGAAVIDTGAVSFVLGAYLGGYASQEDYSTFGVSFLDATNAIIGSASLIGPDNVTRGNATGLLPESLSAFIPVGTRSLVFELGATRLEGVSNDGYADNLSFVASSVATATPAVPFSTGANGPCITASLAYYAALSDAGCTIGPATFYHFSASGGLSAFVGGLSQPVDVLDNIILTPDATGTPGFRFTSDSVTPLPTAFGDNLFQLIAGYAQYRIDYDVDPPIDILGFRLDDDPLENSSVSGDLCIGNTFAVNCPQPGSPNEYQVLINDSQLADSVTFPQGTNFNDVRLTITLDAQNGPASIEGFGTASAVPEPAAIALLGIGGVALLAATVRRRRR